MSDTPRTPEGRFVNPVERRMMFHKGFGDGAKMSAIKFPNDPDYQEGWVAGHDACASYMNHIIEREGLPAPSILRTQEES